MKKIHYAWVICAAGTLLMVCTMGFCATLLTAYLPYITAAGLSGSAASLVTSLRSLSTLTAILFVSQYYERFSLRTGIFMAMSLCAASMAVFSIGGSAPVYFAAACLAGVGYGLGGSIPLSLLIGAWFKGRKGTALGLCSAGSGVAAVFFPKLVDVLATKFGLRAMFLAAAGFIFLSAVVVWLLVRCNPWELGLTAYEGGPEQEKKTVAGESRLPTSGWILLVVLMLVQGGYSPSTTHLSVLMTTSGYSTASAASCLSLFGLSVLIGKLSFGVMADRIGAKLATSAAYIAIVAACLMALLMDGQALWPCALAAVFFGVGCPPNSVGIALVGADLSTPEVLTKTMKWMEVSATLGSIVTGVLPGIYYDAVGDYLGAYVVMAAMAGLCIPLLWVLYRTRQPAHTAAEKG